MINDLLNLCRRRTPTTIAKQSLEETELGRLKAYQALDYAQAMVAYHEAQCTRLAGVLATAEPAERAARFASSMTCAS